MRPTLHDGTAGMRSLASGRKKAVQWNLDEAQKSEGQLQAQTFLPGLKHVASWLLG